MILNTTPPHPQSDYLYLKVYVSNFIVTYLFQTLNSMARVELNCIYTIYICLSNISERYLFKLFYNSTTFNLYGTGNWLWLLPLGSPRDQALLRNPEHIQAYIYWLYIYILYENAAHYIYIPVVYIPHIYVYKDVL